MVSGQLSQCICRAELWRGKPEAGKERLTWHLPSCLYGGILPLPVLIFGAAPIFSLFIHEQEVIPAGADYLRIIGFSEMFMCVELMTVGALSAMGKTMEASVITIILTASRIPLAVILGGTALD